jgi:hypothetical protein
MPTLRTTLAAGALAFGLAAPALAQRAEIRVCDRPNLNGECIELRHGVGDLRRFDFANRVTSFEIRGGRWLMCDQPGFRGRCETFDQSVGNLRRTGFNNAVVSLRPLRGAGGPGGGGGGGWDRTSITLYEHDNYGGRGWTFADDEPDLARYDLADRISSLRVNGGRWNVCVDANYSRCREITGNVPRLRDVGLNDRISSLQEIGSRPGGPGLPGGPLGRAVLYEDVNFGGRSIVVDGPVRNLGELGFNDRMTSLRLPPGESWVICSDANFQGRCATVSGDVPSVPVGFNDRVSSLRPVRR